MILQLLSEIMMLVAMLLALYYGLTRFVLRKHFLEIKQGRSSISKLMAEDIERHIYPNIHGVTQADMVILIVTALLAVMSKVLAIYTYLSTTP